MYLRRAIRGALLVVMFSLLASATSYLFRVLLARSLSVAEYGLLYTFISFFSIFQIFTELGFSKCVPKFIVGLNIEKQQEKIKGLLLTILGFQLAIALLISV